MNWWHRYAAVTPSAATADKELRRLSQEAGTTPEVVLPQIERLVLAPRADWFQAKLSTTKEGSFFVPAALLGFFWLAYRKVYRKAVWSALLWGALIVLAPAIYMNIMDKEPGELRQVNAVWVFVLTISGALGVAFGAGETIRKAAGSRIERSVVGAANLEEVSYRAKLAGGANWFAPVLMIVPAAFGLIVGGVLAIRLVPASPYFTGSGQVPAAALQPAAAQPAAICRIVTSTLKETMAPSDAGLDFGFDFDVVLENTGADGEVVIISRLSSSEGDWFRQRRYAMQAGEVATLTFQFLEPTIGARDLQANATCSGW